MMELRAPLRELLPEAVDDLRERRLRAAIASKRSARQIRRGRLRAAAVGAVAGLVLVAGAGLWRASRTSDAILRLKDGQALARLSVAAAQPSRRFELSDGSAIRLGAGTELLAVHNSARQVALRLGDGWARLHVRPGLARRWTIDAGLASVEVVGTRFVVERSEDCVRVAVDHGIVRVRSAKLAGGVRLLGDGESIAIEIERPAPTLAVAPARVEPVTPIAPAERAAVPAWRELADRGAWGEAFDSLGSAGLGRETRAADGFEDLLVLADVARLSGHPRDAVAPLERLLDSFSQDRRAAVAAFTLGRLQLDVLGDARRGAAAFERALALGLPEALRQSAAARLDELRERTGGAE